MKEDAALLETVQLIEILGSDQYEKVLTEILVFYTQLITETQFIKETTFV